MGNNVWNTAASLSSMKAPSGFIDMPAHTAHSIAWLDTDLGVPIIGLAALVATGVECGLHHLVTCKLAATHKHIV